MPVVAISSNAAGCTARRTTADDTARMARSFTGRFLSDVVILTDYPAEIATNLCSPAAV
jgi:hypothetical protein